MNTWWSQSLRFVIVGLASNLFLYLIYLGLTTMGFGHKSAMTFLYLVGTLQTFIFNKNWTFEHRGIFGFTFVKYVTAYGIGYLINLFAMILFVDRMHFPHTVVQGIMIFVLAVFLFFLQKFWVFPYLKPLPSGECCGQDK